MYLGNRSRPCRELYLVSAKDGIQLIEVTISTSTACHKLEPACSWAATFNPAKPIISMSVPAKDSQLEAVRCRDRLTVIKALLERNLVKGFSDVVAPSGSSTRRFEVEC